MNLEKEIQYGPSTGVEELGNQSFALPASFAQQRLWMIEQLSPGTPVYNVPVNARLLGPLNHKALEKSIHEIVRRHEVLRATFALQDGEVFQVIAPPGPVILPIVNLQHVASSERERLALRLAEEESQTPFNLASGPLLRATLLQLSSEEHFLLITVHHIVFDAWSRAIFMRELGTLYKGFCDDKDSSLSELAIQYPDFAVWQRKYLTGETLEQQLSYWKKQLKDAPALELFPHHTKVVGEPSFCGATESLHLPPRLGEALKSLSHSEGVTLFMTLLSVFKILLYRYSGKEDIVIGTPIAGRNRIETEGLIGFFINNLVLRTSVSGNLTGRQLLQRVRDVTLEGYAHQDLPFEKLVEELHPERNLARTPFFQVTFALQNAPKDPQLPGLKLQRIPRASATAKFDLSFVVVERPEGFQITAVHRSELFDTNLIERMLGHFQILLESIVANPDQKIADLPLLTEPEREQLLANPAAAVVQSRESGCVHRLFEKQVERTPNAIALVFDGEELTYRQLNDKANQIAWSLKACGVGPGVLVAMCLDRSLEMVIGILAILKAGAAYIPLDPAYPPERLGFILEDSSPHILLTQARFLKTLPHHHAQVVCIDNDHGRIAAQSTKNLTSDEEPDNLAYVIYTSGSTGKPKGVLVTHHNIFRLFKTTESWFDFDDKDIWTLFHSYAFDFSVWEIWGALIYGGRLVIVPYWVSRTPEAFYELLYKQKVTILNQTPSAFRQLMQVEEKESKELNLRKIIFGGEALDLQCLKPWFDRHGDKSPQLLNMYGITETTVHVTYRPLSTIDLKTPASVIGVPIPDLELYILDSNRQLLPVGVAGELYVGGEGVANGYLNRPELTSERFIKNPFSKKGNGRLYKTGDLVCRMEDGDLAYLGRIDQQVKIRGFRIELGEIEAAISEFSGVRQNVVIAREDEPGEKRLVAYIVLAAGASLEVSAVRGHLNEKLPEYMVPASFVLLDTLPLTPNGKIDRKALPPPTDFTSRSGPGYVPARDPLESHLIQIWESVLGVTPIGTKDDFFELGGHSLLAVRIMDRIEKDFGKRVPLAALFSAPTVDQLAETILSTDNGGSVMVQVQPGTNKPPLFFFHGDLSGGGLYCLQLAQRIGKEQPFYALQPLGVDGGEVPAGLGEMEDLYLRQIRNIQPEGPYLLGGYCNGGLLALAIATKLQALNHDVSFLGLVDTLPKPGAVRLLRDSVLRLGKVFRLSPPQQLDLYAATHDFAFRVQRAFRARLLFNYLRKRSRRILGNEEKCGSAEFTGDNWLTRNRTFSGDLAKRIERSKRYRKAMKALVPTHYEGQITLFWPKEKVNISPEQVIKRWRHVSSRLEIHELPGDHLTCITQHAGALGDLLREHMLKTERESQSTESKSESEERLVSSGATV